MVKLDIAFVILSYMAVNDTKECVDSILRNSDTNNFKIIIVDNNSSDNTYEILCQDYSQKKEIVILRNSENLGFARGNNVGINFVRENYEVKYIVVLNNDIIFTEKNFLKKLEAVKGDGTDFAVLGPLILTADGKWDSSPINRRLDSKTQLKKMLLFDLLLLKLEYFKLSDLFLRSYRFLYKIRIGKTVKKEVPVRKKDVILHGCFLVFSEAFFKKLDGFNDETFLYHEEEILYIEAKFNNLEMVFEPGIVVFHKEDCSTDSVKEIDWKKKIKKYRCQVHSAKVLLRLYEENRDFKE